jgi:polyisoprenoid-binding protein YceI
MQTRQDDPATTPQLGRYEIDPGGSTVTFRTRHLFGLAPVRGTFAISSGTIDVAEPLAGSGAYAEIEAASFRTGNGQRDGAVRSARFLDAGRHPLITFRSEGIVDAALLLALGGTTPLQPPAASQAPRVSGTLTVRGVSRPVSLAVEVTGVSPGSFSARAATRVDRTEYGVTASRGLAGRYLDLSLEVRCVRR